MRHNLGYGIMPLCIDPRCPRPSHGRLGAGRAGRLPRPIRAASPPPGRGAERHLASRPHAPEHPDPGSEAQAGASVDHGGHQRPLARHRGLHDLPGRPLSAQYLAGAAPGDLAQGGSRLGSLRHPRRLLRRPRLGLQLHSRVGFAHHYGALRRDEFASCSPATGAGSASSSTTPITGGNFRPIRRLFVQIGRILKINGLGAITNDIVHAARATSSSAPPRAEETPPQSVGGHGLWATMAGSRRCMQFRDSVTLPNGVVLKRRVRLHPSWKG